MFEWREGRDKTASVRVRENCACCARLDAQAPRDVRLWHLAAEVGLHSRHQGKANVDKGRLARPRSMVAGRRSSYSNQQQYAQVGSKATVALKLLRGCKVTCSERDVRGSPRSSVEFELCALFLPSAAFGV